MEFGWTREFGVDTTALIRIAGYGQLALVLGSLAIPRVLGWRRETSRLTPLTRQVFWTYALYIWGTNLSFALLSSLRPEWLAQATPLARTVCGFIAAYWGLRLILQFAYFDRSSVTGVTHRLAEAGLVLLFAYCTLVYAKGTLAGTGP